MEYLLTGLPDRKQQMLSRLLPYWGAKIDEGYLITGALKGQTLAVSGLDHVQLQLLMKFLHHTDLQVSESAEPADLNISLNILQSATGPITLEANQTTYHLKPLRKQTDNVQTWIHKRLWLPIRESSLNFNIHMREKKNIPEWLCYLIIQYFMQPAFEPIHDVPFSDYQELTASVLRFLNNELAAQQLSLEQTGQTAWPDPPPAPHSDQKPEDLDSKHQLDPFQPRPDQVKGKPFNPFRHQDKPERSMINPFRKKH